MLIFHSKLPVTVHNGSKKEVYRRQQKQSTFTEWCALHCARVSAAYDSTTQFGMRLAKREILVSKLLFILL